MAAVVTLSDKKDEPRKIKTTQLFDIVHILVGSKVSQRRLRKALAPFEGAFLCAEGITVPKLHPFDTEKPLEQLLFKQFCDCLLSQSGIHVSAGIIDPLGEYVSNPLMTEIVAHCALVTVFTLKDTDELCQRLLNDTGTCPEIVQRKAWLFGCDYVFAPQGLLGFEGTLFGKGGRGIDPELLSVDPQYQPLLQSGIEKSKLWCLLNDVKTIKTPVQPGFAHP